jgi:thiamine kinase-like enzyme
VIDLEEAVFEQARRIGQALQLDFTVENAERLGGLTNRNYRLDTPSGRFVLRLTGVGTSDYIDRTAESVNARVASQAGVNAQVLFFDEVVGVMLTRFLDQAHTMSAELFRDPGTLARAGQALARLHACGPAFQGRFELFEQIERYLSVLRGRQAEIPPGFERVRVHAQEVRDALACHPVPLVACHCDPMVENFLDTGRQMHIIDFEYSGNNDPMWDLGDLSVEGGFDASQDDHLMQGYFNGPASAFDHGRIVMYKAMCDLLWTLWGAVQHADGNPAEDFWEYSVGRLTRCQKLMDTPDFGKHLEAVRAGPV